MTLTVLSKNAVTFRYPFNLTIPSRIDIPDILPYLKQKEKILHEFISAFLAQHPENQQYLSPDLLLSQPTQNPTNLTNPYWQWLVKNDVSAYDLNRLEPTQDYEPLWSVGRMGQSSTLLPDGREILIGGEFEDYYNPLFCIYNDVIVKHPDGKIEIFGYPRHIFAPTDFHTATLVGDTIWLIGSAGYPDERDFSQTSVYKLNIHSYRIEKVETRNSMGWVCRHSATFKDNQIIVTGGEILQAENLPMRENFDEWALNLKTLIWKNISKKNWQCFYVGRKDGNCLLLDDYRTLISYQDKPENEFYQKAFETIRQDTGNNPNLSVFSQLYSPPIDHEIDESEQAYDTFTIFVDAIKVRYKTDWQYIQVYVEGVLPPHKLELLQENLRHKLSKLENYPCEVKAL